MHSPSHSRQFSPGISSSGRCGMIWEGKATNRKRRTRMQPRHVCPSISIRSKIDEAYCLVYLITTKMNCFNMIRSSGGESNTLINTDEPGHWPSPAVGNENLRGGNKLLQSKTLFGSLRKLSIFNRFEVTVVFRVKFFRWWKNLD